MEEKSKEKRINKIEGILQLLWNSYQHIYLVRETKTQNFINFLIVVATFLPIFSVSLLGDKYPYYLFPVILQLMALLILLKPLIIKGMVPWFEYKEILSHLDKGTFAIDVFSELKHMEYVSEKRLKHSRKLIKTSLTLLVTSIYLIALSYIWIYFMGTIQHYVSIVLLTLLFFGVICFYNMKPTETKKDYTKQEIREEIERWVNGKSE